MNNVRGALAPRRHAFFASDAPDGRRNTIWDRTTQLCTSDAAIAREASSRRRRSPVPLPSCEIAVSNSMVPLSPVGGVAAVDTDPIKALISAAVGGTVDVAAARYAFRIEELI